MLASTGILLALIISAVIDIGLIIYLSKFQNKNQLSRMFTLTLILLFVWVFFLILQLTLSIPLNIEPIYFEYLVYIGACFLPVTVFFVGLIYYKTEIKFKPVYLLTLVVPIISLIALWTNDIHHLFYDYYSVDLGLAKYGPFSDLHTYYSYIMLGLGMFYLLRTTAKGSRILSRQSLLILFGISVPIVVNILGTFQIINMSVYMTPITFFIAIVLCAISIFKYQFLGVAPIALQIVVNQISDSYVVLGVYNNIVDFNETFVKTFKMNANELKNAGFRDLLEHSGTSETETNKIMALIQRSSDKFKPARFEQAFKKLDKIFQIEITAIKSNGNQIGTLVLLRDITQHKHDMQTIKDNQEILMEKERLASLGQLIGGITHNLKTPIMSISGAVQGLTDLVGEFDSSIGNPIVNDDDFHDIAKDMTEWLGKINSYTEYMSDILTAVKGQAVNLVNQEENYFTLSELFKTVNILMRHELKKAVIYLNISMKVDENIVIRGDVNSLVQVVNNMISNSIQAYEGKPEQHIDLTAWKNDKGNVVISVKDYGPGLPDSVKTKLFKEMITTKGKNGTGLGLYMSYSTIKGNFNGDITVESKPGKGTTFNIILPI